MNTNTPFEPRSRPMIMTDTRGNHSAVSVYGQQIVGLTKEDILCRFEYSNSTYDVNTTVTGTGAASNSNSLAIVSTGSGVGSCKITSRRYTAYRPAHETHSHWSSIFSAGEANTSQSSGLFDAQDGFFFGFSGTTFGVTLRKGAVDTFIPQTNWNIDKLDNSRLSFTLDPLKLNQYKVSFGWLGISPVFFCVYCGIEHGWQPVHVLDLGNIQTGVSILSPCLPFTFEVSRTSGSGAKTIGVGSFEAGTTEGIHAHPGHRVFAAAINKTLVGGVETLVGTFSNKSTFLSKTNKVRTEATFFGASTDGTKPVVYKFYRNATITTPTYVDIDTNNSVTATSANASDVAISFRWEEFFS